MNNDALKLYNLIKDYEIHNDGLIFVDYYKVETFFKELNIIHSSYFSDDVEVKAYLKDTYLCFDITDICEELDLDFEYVKETLIN